MKYAKFLAFTLFVSLLGLTSCKDDDDKTPITEGSTVTVTNTLQSTTITNGEELTIEALFQMEANALAATATVSDAIEFDNYLLNLYDIDISENQIKFDLVAPADSETYSTFFRTLEAGTTDRYYLTFTEAQNVTGFTSNNTSVNLRIDSEKVLVVEIGEGFNFNPGTSFTIELK